MAVNFIITGTKHESDEYQAALQLQGIISEQLGNSVLGEIYLFPNATLMGQATNDVDIIVIGMLRNYRDIFEFNDHGVPKKDYVMVDSFAVTIEVKSHDSSGIFRKGTDIFVKYGRNAHSVTHQSNEQKTSTFLFFTSTLGFSPYVTNLILFTGITNKDVSEILSVGKNEMPSNVMGNDFSLHDFMQLQIGQTNIKYYSNAFHYNSIPNGLNPVDFARALSAFTKAKECMGELTRKRIEVLTKETLEENDIYKDSSGILMLRGRAGTGKTVGIIQNAIRLVDEFGKRVLILTYNRALVSDIRRLFTLAELPDLFEESCVHINTMHSFFYKLINEVLYSGKLDGDRFLTRYESYLDEFISFAKEDSENEDVINEIIKSDAELSWDYIMIDEAQDWTKRERDLILLLFKNNIIIADGGMQFVRNVEVCDWSIVSGRKNVKLKTCLRQKKNLINFINHFSKEYGNINAISGSEKFPGGKVIIVGEDNYFKVLKRELKSLKDSGNIPYDMLYFVPPSLVETVDGEHRFINVKQYEKNDILIWDGTNETNRRNYSVLGNEARLLQYESARGLEAWTVCCVHFDVFVENKMSSFEPESQASALLLESREEQFSKYILNWILMPLTRGIDTIIISLNDIDSEVGKILKAMSEEYADYVQWEV